MRGINQNTNLRETALQVVIGWLLWTAFMTVVLHRLGLSWQLSVADALLFNLVIGLFSAIVILLYRYYPSGLSERIYRLIFVLVMSRVSVAVFGFLAAHIAADDAAYTTFLEASIPLRFVFSFLVISFVTVIWVMKFFQDEQQRLLKKQQENERLQREAELLNLRQQLQPHFLFNSLNSINALAGSDPVKTRRMIEQLSEFLRGTLKKDENRPVTLREELRQMELYLEIERVRFGHRLSFEISCAEECLDALIPPLLLQPLVENAIKFGLYGTLGNVALTLKASCSDGFLELSISNPYSSDTSAAPAGTGFGLDSVQRRLFLLYSRHDLLHADRQEGRFVTRLKIPQPL